MATLEENVETIMQDVAVNKGNITNIKADTTAVKTDTTAIKADVAVVKTDTATIKDTAADIKTNTDDIKAKTADMDVTQLPDVRSKLASIIDLDTDIRGGIPDVRKDVDEVKMVRLYLGDVPGRLESTGEAVAKLIAGGYRPYMNLGQTKDWSVWAFVKYAGYNAPVTE